MFVEWYLIVVLIFKVCFPMHNMECVFKSSFIFTGEMSVQTLCIVFVGLFICLLLKSEDSLYILN